MGHLDDMGSTQAELSRLRLLERCLGEVITVLASDGKLNATLAAVNWKAIDFSHKELELWWSEHRKRETERRQLATAAERDEQKRKSALKKLTPAERRVLGL